MKIEIGSEFWDNSYPNKVKTNLSDQIEYLLSGRTAIDYIIKDIKKSINFKKVMMPSYCCESMIEPFLRNNVKVEFYKVTASNIEYTENNADAILLLDYFGYRNESIREIAEKGKKSKKIIIYDATHKINEIKFPADYVFCSYRKWTFCNFAIAKKNSGQFNYHCEKKINKEYVDLRKKAAKQKEAYINGVHDSKECFLTKFEKAEKVLAKDYIGYEGDKEEIDQNAIIEKRQQNAKQLINGIKHIQQIKIWFHNVNDDDAPLFVPILLDNKTRNKLHEHLKCNNIFCPTHWPKSAIIMDCDELYQTELSLICDQRYNEKDIDREIDVINYFFQKNQI